MVTPPRKMVESGMLKDIRRAINNLIDFARESAPVGGPGVNVRRTSNGSIIKATAVQEAGVSIKQYMLKEVHGDYLMCHSWDGENEGETDIFVAKPFRLRREPFDQQTITFDDYAATFSYTDGTRRTATIDGIDEEQIIVPHYVPDLDIIYAVNCDDLNIETIDEEQVSLLDINADGRAWAGPRPS